MKTLKQLFAIAPLALVITACSVNGPDSGVTSTNLKQHENFRGGEVEFAAQQNWYRELRLNDWKILGITDADLESVLPRIQGKGALRDTMTVYGQGQWTYEWSLQAAEVAKKAAEEKVTDLAARLYQRASALYLVASYPNLLTEPEQRALNQSAELYIKAASLRGENVTRITMPLAAGGNITGLLHLPNKDRKDDKQSLPVILWTGGVDKTLVEHHTSIQKYVDKGYAVITFDMPGGGLNKGIRLEVGHESRSHDAALQYVKNSPVLDQGRVAALTSSGGGVSLMEFALKNSQLKAVVARCTLVDGVLTRPEHLQFVPRMSVDSFFARLGHSYETVESPGTITKPLSLKAKGYFDGLPKTDIPLLVINTKDDPVASPKDMRATAAMSSRGELAFYGEAGHCPEGKEAEERIYQFITLNLSAG
ncbi:alpha/beta hydrolase [Spongorhabdus nitratireducens]